MLLQDDELAAFQSLLLDTLHSKTSPEDILEELRKSRLSEPFKEWIDQIDTCMLEFGAKIVKKWAKKINNSA